MEVKTQSQIKREFRKKLSQNRNRIGEEIRRQAPKSCLKHLTALKEYQDAEWIYLYLSYRSELDTISLLPDFRKDNKKIAVPRVYGEKMEFHEITGLNQCEIGSYGIREPLKSCPKVTRAGVMLLPGLGFDKAGRRMGYGGGYYDRYLGEHPDIIKIGLAFDEQIVSEIPTDSHDILMDYILTPSGLWLGAKEALL